MHIFLDRQISQRSNLTKVGAKI